MCSLVLQCGLVCFNLFAAIAICAHHLVYSVVVCCSILYFVAVCSSVLQCVAVCCSLLQCATVRCISHTQMHQFKITNRCDTLSPMRRLNSVRDFCAPTSKSVLPATYCNTLQHKVCLQHTATQRAKFMASLPSQYCLQHTATQCNTMQHAVQHKVCLQHTATQRARFPCLNFRVNIACNTLQHTATQCNTHCNTKSACNTLQHNVQDVCGSACKSVVALLHTAHCKTHCETH